MPHDVRSVFNDIKTGKIAPVYFFFGEESYPIDHLVQQLRDILDPSTRDFNFDYFSGDSVEVDGLVAIARSFPMMSEKRVVILNDVQRLSSSDRNRLMDYVLSPMDSTCLILLSERADRRQKFWSTLTDCSVWIESRPLYENQAVDWVVQRLQHRQIQIAQDAAKLLVQHVGTSLWNLHQELNKLTTYNCGKPALNRDDILAVVGISREYNIWELTDVIARRDTKQALLILSHLIDAKQSPVGMIMDLTRRILILIRIKLLSERHIPAEQMAKLVSLKPYFVKLFTEQALKFTLIEIQQALETLYQADRSIKSGLLDPVMAMTLIIFDVTRKNQYRFFQ